MDFQKFSERIANLDYDKLERLAKICRGDILTMTTLAKSGHPGGSMSSIDALLTVYSVANIFRHDLMNPLRDRIIVSHGHISPAVYSCLHAIDILPHDEYIAYFRKAGSMYEGHIERTIPAVEWTTGNLGQGLSAAAGFATAGSVLERDFDVYVFMGDGEQGKGQITEARRYIKKYGYSNVTCLIDYNRLQISGSIEKVMPSLDIAKSFESDGWKVLKVDGHNFRDIAAALLKAKSCDSPTCILLETTMGKGVSFMENKECYHGAPLPEDDYYKAMAELGLESKLDHYKEMRKNFIWAAPHIKAENPRLVIDTGKRIVYHRDVKTDNRSAFGAALLDMVKRNHGNGNTEVIVFDCDLASSVKTNAIEKEVPSNFFQCGIAEHHTAVCAGAASTQGVVSFFAGFGMFVIDEPYNQNRLNEINSTNLKLVTTHVGIDVGEDGKTHMCIDYIGLMRNIFNFRLISPADPNETDAIIRYICTQNGNYHVAMGRSKLPIILDNANGEPFFGEDYEFKYGKGIYLRSASDSSKKVLLLSFGGMSYRACEAWEALKEKGVYFSVMHISSPIYIDNETLEDILSYEKVFVYEDHNADTGLYSTIANELVAYISKLENPANCHIPKIYSYAITQFPVSGSAEDVYDMLGLSANKLVERLSKDI